MIKEIPILFSTAMVQAELDDLKTMTRRTTDLESINETPSNWEFVRFQDNAKGGLSAVFKRKDCILHTAIPCRYGRPGDLLWVRESWAAAWKQVLYKANERYGKYEGQKWKPSIHMPKVVARIWLQVTDVRVERLQDISEQDAIAEGIEECNICSSTLEKEYKDYCNELKRIGDSKTWGLSPVGSFKSLWTKINGADSWQANPWVWVISFRVLSTTGKPDLKQ